MAELFKFRCPRCEKLLGVSPKKAGRPVQCPQCGTELIVPSAEEEEVVGQSPDLDSPNAMGDLGIDLGFSPSLDLRPVDRAGPKAGDRAVDEAEAIAFLEQSALIEDPEPIESGPSAGPDEVSTDFDSDPEPEPFVQTAVEPLIARSGRPRAFESAVDRRRDVVLPRTAVVAWSLFALLALASSFVAGLMVGHYRWK